MSRLGDLADARLRKMLEREAQRREVLRLRAEGLDNGVIAQRTGLSRRHVRRILNEPAPQEVSALAC